MFKLHFAETQEKERFPKEHFIKNIAFLYIV